MPRAATARAATALAATTVAAVLAFAGIATAQHATTPIGADPIGSAPIGGDQIGSTSVAPDPIRPDPIGSAPSASGGAAAASPFGSPRPSVRGYVANQSGPSATLTQPVVVGEPLPAVVGLRAVPNSDYAYALVGGRRIIVDPETRRVVEILD
jgi:hypothetical protein